MQQPRILFLISLIMADWAVSVGWTRGDQAARGSAFIYDDYQWGYLQAIAGKRNGFLSRDDEKGRVLNKVRLLHPPGDG